MLITDLLTHHIHSFFSQCVALMVMYRLDNNRTNPYNIWLTAGKPDYPPYQLLQQMRDAIVSLTEVATIHDIFFTGHSSNK